MEKEKRIKEYIKIIIKKPRLRIYRICHNNRKLSALCDQQKKGQNMSLFFFFLKISLSLFLLPDSVFALVVSELEETGPVQRQPVLHQRPVRQSEQGPLRIFHITSRGFFTSCSADFQLIFSSFYLWL